VSATRGMILGGAMRALDYMLHAGEHKTQRCQAPQHAEGLRAAC
jgi:hypothetical protein